MEFLKTQWRYLVVAFASSMGLALMWLLPPYLISVIIDRALPTGDTTLLSQLIIGIACVAIFIILLMTLQTYCMVQAGENVMRDMRIRLFNAIQSQSYRFFIHNDAGTVSSRMWNDLGDVQIIIRTALVNIVSSFLLVTATLTFMFAWNWQLTLLLLVMWPVVIAISIISAHLNRKATDVLFDWGVETSSFTLDRLNVNGYILLNGVGYDQLSDSQKFRSMSDTFARLWIRQSVTKQIMTTLLVVFPLISSTIIYFYGGLDVIDGELSLGVLVAFVALSMRLASPVSDLAEIHVTMAGASVLLERILEWIYMTPEVADRPDAKSLGTVVGQLSLKNATVEHEPGHPVIDDLSVEFQPNHMSAIVGRSGAGKTTLTHLILRFYDPNSGSVEIDGHDLRSIKLTSLRKHLSLVPQESVVFNVSIKENLLLANPQASEEDLISACKASQLHDLIEGLPDGYNTVVGDFGYRLSGGERQRLSIARVILKQPSVIILDEPTSSLDSITERAIRNALDNFMGNTTTIIIAHRLSTILNADSILVLDEGRFVDCGRHQQLLLRCDLYRSLYQEQFEPQMSGTTTVATCLTDNT